MLSRYEEYLPGNRDVLGRFSAKQSLAYQHGFLKHPVVHQWAALLADALSVIYPALSFSTPSYQFLPTLDIDNAYAYKGKGILRTIGAAFRDLLRLNHRGFLTRWLVLTGFKEDPYDTFDYLMETHDRHRVQPLIFWLVGDYGMYDKNIALDRKLFRQLIQKVSARLATGIHPSFSSQSSGTLLLEKERLEKITQGMITKCRMHYLKVHLPATYRLLIDAGIQSDYSMGFSEESGFRAGVAVPFEFYDLTKEKITTLRIHPFCIMDATFMYHKKMNPMDAWVEIEQLIVEVKKVNGVFCTVFHNESLGTQWPGWREVYEKILVHARKPAAS